MREFEREGEGEQVQVKKEYRTKGGNLGDTSTSATITYGVVSRVRGKNVQW